MKYEKCLSCKQLGNSCDGPNLLMMEAVELGQWCNELRKKLPGMTYDKTANETGVSKTAIYGFLTGAHTDFRIETVRPIARLYIGGDCDNNPCGNVSTSDKAEYEEKIRLLETEIKEYRNSIQWRDDKISHFEKENKRLVELNESKDKRHQQSQDFLRTEMKRKNRVITILAMSIVAMLFVIIAALIIDRLNPEIGFFWLRSLFDIGSNDITKIITT